MIIDSHQHVFWHGRDDAGLIADMAKNCIAKAWLLTWEIAPWEDQPSYHAILNPAHMRPDGTHAGIPLSDLVLARRHFPDRFVLGFCPHPLIGDAPARLEAAVNMHGVKVCGEWKFRVLLDDPRCLQLFWKAGELKLPVVLHLDVPFLRDSNGVMAYRRKWYGGTVRNLERTLQACPDTCFIGHAPGFWREISARAEDCPDVYPDGPVNAPGELHRLFDTYPNLYADLSAGSGLTALKRDTGHAREFLATYADRLLFGRDYYGSELQDHLATLGLPSDAWQKIAFGNARRLLGEAEATL